VYAAGKLDIARFTGELSEPLDWPSAEQYTGPHIKPEDEWFTQFEGCDRAIQRFKETAPSLHTARDVTEITHLVLAHGKNQSLLQHLYTFSTD
jgi:hypothetical protein